MKEKEKEIVAVIMPIIIKTICVCVCVLHNELFSRCQMRIRFCILWIFLFCFVNNSVWLCYKYHRPLFFFYSFRLFFCTQINYVWKSNFLNIWKSSEKKNFFSIILNVWCCLFSMEYSEIWILSFVWVVLCV